MFYKASLRLPGYAARVTLATQLGLWTEGWGGLEDRGMGAGCYEMKAIRKHALQRQALIENLS